jgi:DNA modification methylase
MSDIKVDYLNINILIPYKGNARTHSRKQINQLTASIEEFGFTNPILIDENKMVLAGHGRLLAAKKLGISEIPCVRLDHMTEVQKRAYILADNKLSLNAGWDEDLLATELEFLLNEEIDFDVDITGFSIAEVDMIIEDSHKEEPDDPADDLPINDKNLKDVALGDLWQLGRHRLICGDSLSPDIVQTLMDGKKARMVFTDPPYNVPIDGFVSGKGIIRHKEFEMAAGEMTEDQFTRFLMSAFKNLTDHSLDGSIHFICMDWRHMQEMLSAGQEVYTELKNLIIWSKDNGGMGTFYRSKHELIFAFKNGTADHINSFELGQHGRYRTNVWNYKGVNSRSSERMEELSLHPTVKPVQMIADAIRDVSGRGEIVLDLFGGSGSTLIAAQKTGRTSYLCELDPLYVARTIKRYEKFSKDEAVKIACGISETAIRTSSGVSND